ncbi:MAG: hypothetical protein B6241_08710 [Spirochaetaceae bacterium 4572_59]|nr:MAG: hypothetical protein B6241_08710 [Spirochaetaceae bacterium 4572_59]
MKRKWSLLISLLLAQICLRAQSPEIPAPRPDDQLIYHENYTLSYNEEFEQADWVAYELTRQEVLGSEKRADNFRSDPLITSHSASLNDYRGSGYDRGHLAPAADMKFSPHAMSESFYLSNMSPQDPSFNRGIWKKLEALVRQWAYENKSIYVVTGPVLNKKDYIRIGANAVAVPEYYYKVILDMEEPGIKCIGFILPNKKSDFPPSSYALSVDDVEIMTGIDFFPALEDDLEIELEARFDKDLWNFESYQLPKGKAASTEQTMEGVEYWINSSNGTRHNPGCRYYGNTKNGYFTDKKEGDPCGLCGG